MGKKYKGWIIWVSTKHWPPVNWTPTDPQLTPLLTLYKINGKMKMKKAQNYQWDRFKFMNKFILPQTSKMADAL